MLSTLLTIAIPTLAVMFGILLNRQDATAIRAEMKFEIGQLRSELKADMNQLRSAVTSDINQLRSEVITLRDNIHSDMTGVHERLRAVETRQGI